MKITVKNPSKTTWFRNVEYGEVFRYEGEILMYLRSEGDYDCWCVNLSNGQQIQLADNDEVELLDAELVITPRENS